MTADALHTQRATAEHVHGRGDLPFPHVSQAYLIERHVSDLDGTPPWPSRYMDRPFTILGLTS